MTEIISKSVVFRPKARIMRTLGEELISSETVAILELVKNSYDADASKVLIRFNAPLEKGKGSIEIIDNGHGMSLGVVESAWMEPATEFKKIQKRSPKYKRKILGEKGVGRFAVSRLAGELDLISRAENSNEEIVVLFDWSQFDNPDKYLDQIVVLAEATYPKEIIPGGIIDFLWQEEKLPPSKERTHGTILRMKRLGATWSEENFKTLQRGLSRMVSPFEKNRDFSIRFELPPNFSNYSTNIEPPPVIKYPHYSIVGKIEEFGKFEFEISVYDRGIKKNLEGWYGWLKSTDDHFEFYKLDEERYQNNKDSNDFRHVETGPFEFEFRVWDRDEFGNVEQKTGSSIKDIRKDLDEFAGINIYRDGFRVLPYGEPKNDWLRLDIRRVQKPTKNLSNNQILGFVKISSDKNPELKDQSNREGMMENQALEDLRSIITTILSELEEVRYGLRARKGEKQIPMPLRSLFSVMSIQDLQDKMLVKYPEDFETRALIESTQKQLEQQFEDVKTVIGRYQNLAALGTLIDIVLHDGRHPVSKIVDEAWFGKKDIDKTEVTEFLKHLYKRFDVIDKEATLLTTLFHKIEPFGGRKRGRPEKLYIEEIIKESINVIDSEIRRLKIKITIPPSETLVRVDRSEIQQVFINLLSNSIYWLHPESQREIFIEVKRKGEEHVEILFSDSGPGIAPENRDNIFEPYFSTKPDGVGLGLAITGEIVRDFYNGTLELLEDGPLKGATFLITLKKRI